MFVILIHVLAMHFHLRSQISAMHPVLYSMHLRCWPFCSALLKESSLPKQVYVWLHLSHYYLQVSRVWRPGLSVAHCSLLPWFKVSIKQIYFCPLMCHRQNTELFEVDSCQVKFKVKSNGGASVCDVLHKMQANDWRAMISLLWVQGYSNQCGLQNDCVIMNCYKHHITQSIYVDICSCVHFNIWCKQLIL